MILQAVPVFQQQQFCFVDGIGPDMGRGHFPTRIGHVQPIIEQMGAIHLATGKGQREQHTIDMAAVERVTGGGAGFFELAIKDAFPQLKVSTPDTPVFANVRGFWRMGV